MTEKYIYKICAKAEWDSAVAAGVYNGSRIDEKSGFIHFSTAEQAVETASKHFFGIHGLVLIKIDSESLGDALKWEKSRNICSSQKADGHAPPHRSAACP